MRLQIHPGLVWAWRAPGRLQVGLDPRHGVILDGLSARDELVLQALRRGTESARLPTLAVRSGLTVTRVRELVDVVRGAGLLVPRHTSPTRLRSVPAAAVETLRPHAARLALTYPGGDGWDVLVARAARCVAVSGAGATGIAVAVGLARAAVGHLVVVDDARVSDTDVHPGGYRPQDVGRRREAAGPEVLRRAVPSVRTGTTGSAAPDLVVAVRSDGVDASRYDVLLRDDVPHLVVLLRERDAVVGPLVRPGRSCCLRCVDLHRRDRDPEWPRVVPQVAARTAGPEDPVLSALAVALTVAQALTELDRRVDPASLGATLEIALPDGTTSVRDWPAHHQCGCRAVPGTGGRAVRTGAPDESRALRAAGSASGQS